MKWRDRARRAPLQLGLLLAVSCGGRAESGDTSGARDVPDDEPLSGEIEVVVSAQSLFDASQAPYNRSRIVARNGGFDFLAGRDDKPWGAVARHARIAGDAWQFAGAAAVVVNGDHNSFEASADGERLTICHNQFSATPIRWSRFSGAYDKELERTMPGYAALCEGIAFHGGRGLLAVHRRGDDGTCCSRAELFDLDGDDVITPGREALPAGEYGDVSLSAYPNGFVWAGYLDSARAVHVAFARADGTEAVALIQGESSGGRPAIEPWPHRADAVAVSWQETDQRVRLVAVTEEGDVVFDHVIERPDARWLSRPAMAGTAGAFVVATGVCPELGEEGVTELAVLDAAGAATDSMTFAGCGQPRLAASGDTAVLMWADGDDGYQATALRITP